MYTPPHNRQADRAEILGFVREFPFATLVTCGDGGMTATHLPLSVSEKDGSLRITGHLAKANEQAGQLASGREAMAIFQAPHAYIAPEHYGPGKWVPTWNYVAVHLYGTPVVLETSDEKLEVLAETIAAHDPGFQQTLDSYPAEFVDGKLKGIVAFTIPVRRVDARWKLSQDRKPVERERISLALRLSSDPSAHRLAEFMEPHLPLEAR